MGTTRESRRDGGVTVITETAHGDPGWNGISVADEPEPLSRPTKAWWWARDYVYAAGRQLALLAPPWAAIGGRRPTPRAWASSSGGLPDVVLVPGVYEHWTFLRPLGDALSAAGHRVRVVHGLGSNRRGIGETAERLHRALARSRPPAAGRVLVAHSKGGLIGKQLLVTPGSATLGILGIVAVCTPFAGSRRARLLMDPSIRALSPTNETIVLLGRDTSVNARIVSVFGRYDPHIPDGSLLDGATNVRVPAAGHFRLLGAPETADAVLDGIALLASGSLAE